MYSTKSIKKGLLIVNMYDKRKQRQNKANNNESVENKPNINWFPGHMAKTERKIKEDLKLVDIVAEVIDARIPISSRNPILKKIINQKKHIVVLNKCDMADSKETAKWINKFKNDGICAVAVDAKTGNGINKFVSECQTLMNDKILSWKSKGMKTRRIRIMIVGVPNVGKSSLINRLSKGNKAKVEDRPGVTRGNQWFSVGTSLELLDTPGVLWHKFNNRKTGENLAITGAIKDQVVDIEDLAFNFSVFLKNNYINNLLDRYKISKEEIENKKGHEILEIIGKKRGMIISGGNADIERASIMLLNEFRATKIGKITLEKCL